MVKEKLYLYNETSGNESNNFVFVGNKIPSDKSMLW